MTIVRELITKIKFSFDKKDVETFNKSIEGFRNGFKKTSAIATATVASFLTLAKGVSDSILNASELARQTGVATEDLVSLQKAASKFRISEDQFNSAFKSLNKQIFDAEQGFGGLLKLNKDLRLGLIITNGSLENTDIVFEKIIEGLSKVRSDSLRANLSEQIFDTTRFADIAKEGIESFRLLRKELKPIGKDISDAEESAKLFDRSLNSLFVSIGRFSNIVVPPFFKLLSQAFEGLTIISENLTKPVDESAQPFFRQRVVDRQNEINQNLNRALESSSPEVKQRFNDRKITVTNNITVQPPAGFEENQRSFFEEAAEKILALNISDTFEEVLNNFPEKE